MAFSSGLSVPTMSKHHPAAQRRKNITETERERVKPKRPKTAQPLATRSGVERLSIAAPERLDLSNGGEEGGRGKLVL